MVDWPHAKSATMESKTAYLVTRKQERKREESGVPPSPWGYIPSDLRPADSTILGNKSPTRAEEHKSEPQLPQDHPKPLEVRGRWDLHPHLWQIYSRCSYWSRSILDIDTSAKKLPYFRIHLIFHWRGFHLTFKEKWLICSLMIWWRIKSRIS